MAVAFKFKAKLESFYMQYERKIWMTIAILTVSAIVAYPPALFIVSSGSLR